MHFVDDVDAILAAGWRKPSPRDEIPRFLHTAIGGPVDFDDIEVIAPHDRFGDGGRILEIIGNVHCTSKEPRHGRLSDATRAGKEIRMGRPITLDGPTKRIGNGCLTNDFSKVLAAVAAGQNGVGHLKNSSRTVGPEAESIAIKQKNGGTGRSVVGGQETNGVGSDAYGCCDQALTRFTGRPPGGPGRLPHSCRSWYPLTGRWYTRPNART